MAVDTMAEDGTAEDATAELSNLGWMLRLNHQILTNYHGRGVRSPPDLYPSF